MLDVLWWKVDMKKQCKRSWTDKTCGDVAQTNKTGMSRNTATSVHPPRAASFHRALECLPPAQTSAYYFTLITRKPVYIRIYLGHYDSIIRIPTDYSWALRLFGLLEAISQSTNELLSLKPYSKFSNSAFKGSTGWWLENRFLLPEPQTRWNLLVLVSSKPWVTIQVFGPLLGFQDHSQTVQPILKYSFVWLDYSSSCIINTKPRLPRNQFTLHLNCSQAEASHHLRTSHQFKYQHRFALRYFNLYNPCYDCFGLSQTKFITNVVMSP